MRIALKASINQPSVSFTGGLTTGQPQKAIFWCKFIPKLICAHCEPQRSVSKGGREGASTKFAGWPRGVLNLQHCMLNKHCY